MLAAVARRRVSLKPQLNQIRVWSAEGRTDTWIAHALDTTPQTIALFRSEFGLTRGGGTQALEPVTPESVVLELDAADQLAEAAASQSRELEPEREQEPEADAAPTAVAKAAPRRRRRTAAKPEPAAEPAAEPVAEPVAVIEAPAAAEPESDAAPADGVPRRRRRRRRGPRQLSASLVSGAVIVLDQAVLDDAAFREHWAGGSPLVVAEISADSIVLRRSDDPRRRSTDDI